MPRKSQTSKSSRPSVKRAAFLAAYAKCGNVTEAARLAKVARSQHYEWMEDSEYAAAFANAHHEACDLLEAEARRRAVEGVQEPVVYQGECSYKPDSLGRRTNRILTIRKYSDVLLIFLMKGAMPDKYRDNVKHEISGNVNLIERLAAGRARVAKRDDRQG